MTVFVDFDSRRRLNCLLGYVGVWYVISTTPRTLLGGFLALYDAQACSSASDNTKKQSNGNRHTVNIRVNNIWIDVLQTISNPSDMNDDCIYVGE